MKKLFTLMLLGQAAFGFSTDNGAMDQSYHAPASSLQDNPKVSDAEITKKLKHKLSSGWHSKSYENVSYDVRDGVVTLKGTVDTQENKVKAENAVKQIHGVMQINNQIMIQKK